MSAFTPNKQARGLAASIKLNHLAVCSNFGRIRIRKLDDLDIKVDSLKDANEWSEVARYSPSEEHLAVGSHDNTIYVYNAGETYSLLCKFSQHASFITSMDWSEEGDYIRSTDGGHELLFWNLETRERDPSGHTSTVDKLWATNTIKKGEDRDCCKPSGEDGTHINYFNRSPDSTIICTADDFGLVNVFDYPVTSQNAGSRSYAGHSEHVVRVEFSADGTRLFSVGGQDKALIQWKIK